MAPSAFSFVAIRRLAEVKSACNSATRLVMRLARNGQELIARKEHQQRQQQGDEGEGEPPSQRCESVSDATHVLPRRGVAPVDGAAQAVPDAAHRLDSLVRRVAELGPQVANVDLDDGWDVRGRWFGMVIGATPRTGELRRGQTIPWRVIAAQIAPGERRGSR